MENLDLSLIVAMTTNRVIGRHNELPWRRLPSDLRRFKMITSEVGSVVMGYNTFESIIARNGTPLPDRHNIVVTRNHVLPQHACVEAVASLEAACEAVKKRGGKACVIGGAKIYELFLPLVRRAHITTVHMEMSGDAHFPELGTGWKVLNDLRPAHHNMNDEYRTSFQELVRI